MSTNYCIYYSDNKLSFVVAPYTANGPDSPADEELHRGAITAETSLAFVGKWYTDYGEVIQENLLHLMEHFANSVEPVYPIPGQIWYDSKNNAIRVYNSKKHVNSSTNSSMITIEGNHFSRFNQLIQEGRSIRLFEPGNTGEKIDLKITAVAVDSNLRTNITVINSTGLIPNSWTVGGWDDILSVKNGQIDAGGAQIKNVADPVDPQDAVNLQSLTDKFSNLIIGLDSLNDVTLDAIVDNQTLVYDEGTSQWVNRTLRDSILAEGDLTLGGNIDFNGNTASGFGAPIDVNFQYINNVKTPSELDPSDDMKAVNVQFVKNYFPVGIPGAGATRLSHLSDVNSNIDTEREIGGVLGFDGQYWTSFDQDSLKESLRFVPLSGTGLYNDSEPRFMDLGATIEYHPSSFSGKTWDDVGDYSLVTKEMIDAKDVDSDTKVQFGEFDNQGNVINLGWETSAPSNPIKTGFPVDGTEDGVRFKMDVMSAYHNAKSPTDDPNEHLYFEKTLAKDFETYPKVSLGDVINLINTSLGKLSAFPSRNVYSANSINQDAKRTQNLGVDYVVGQSNLEVYVEGIKQVASSPNWIKCNLEENGSDYKMERRYSIAGAVGDDLESFPTFMINGDQVKRFRELASKGQSFDVVNSSNNPIPESPFVPVAANFNPLDNTTEIVVDKSFETPSGELSDYEMIDYGFYNTDKMISGGFPSGLDPSKIYSFGIEVNSDEFLFPVISGGKLRNSGLRTERNVAEVVEAINDWSSSNGAHFSAFIDRGGLYFISTSPGEDSSVSIFNQIPMTYPLSYIIVDIYDDPANPGNNMAFEIDGDERNVFINGLSFNVIGSSGNNGVYTVKEAQREGNNTRVFVTEGNIPSQNSDGSLEVVPDRLFDEMKGGSTILGESYYYAFDVGNMSEWPKKTDTEGLVLDGDYSEVGMIGETSQTIVWTRPFPPTLPSNAKVEVIIRSTLE